MIKIFLGPRLTSVCEAWCDEKMRYGQVSIFYNFYQYKFISLENYEFLRNKAKFTRDDFHGTCLSPFAVSASKVRTTRCWMEHDDWVELIKMRRDESEIVDLLPPIMAIYPCYSTLKHILLKVASNAKLKGDSLIPLHVMFNYRIPAKLIAAYYERLVKHRPKNVFASFPKIYYGMEDLDYLVAIRPIIQPLFPQHYIWALRTIIWSNLSHVGIDRVITTILESHELFFGKARFCWLFEFASIYRSGLSDAQLDRFLPVFNEYCASSLNPGSPSKIVIRSHQLMLCLFKSQHNFWAPKFFLWFLSDSCWFDRRSRYHLISYLRKTLTVIPWIFDSLSPYLCELDANERFVAEQNLAIFIRRIMDAGTWANNVRWERTDEIVKKFLTIVNPASSRKLVGLIYYPHAVSRAFLNFDYDLESADPDVIRYNFLKMRSTMH